MNKKYDFSGWATRNDLKCSDGRTIRKDAFKDNDGQIVPLVWNHQHNDSDNVLGHALLENRPEGVYAYCFCNDTEKGQNAKLLVQHGDITGLSIYANKLKQIGGDVLHGAIREVSLVLAGANPGAFIDSVMLHGDESEEDGIIYTGEDLVLEHSDKTTAEEEDEISHKENDSIDKKDEEGEKEKKEMPEKTIKDVVDSMSEEQKKVMYALIGMAVEDAKGDLEDDEEGEDVKHNLFDNDTEREDVISHSDVMTAIADAKRNGSLREAFLAHGIDNIEYLFPDYKNVDNSLQFLKRNDGWVSDVMGEVNHTSFSRIKSIFANLTEDQARAKGYLKGKLKKEQVFSLLKRSTSPQTVYKLQKLDRDDIVDITDFDIVADVKREMREMLDEEIARAILIGDGRLASDDDKIHEDNIRPVFNDADLFTIKATVAAGTTDAETAANFIDETIKARKNYKGSGNPTLYTTEDLLAEMLLLKNQIGERLYKSEADLATAMRVKKIVAVEPMEGLTDANGNDVLGVIVNLKDYKVGADKGGAVNMFDDFDIDFNKYTYLIETRCSGALVRPYSAITFTKVA